MDDGVVRLVAAAFDLAGSDEAGMEGVAKFFRRYLPFAALFPSCRRCCLCWPWQDWMDGSRAYQHQLRVVGAVTPGVARKQLHAFDGGMGADVEVGQR